MIKLKKILLTITSPSPGNGKSTISIKLAEGLSKIKKRVLLVDNDLKEGRYINILISKAYLKKNSIRLMSKQLISI